VGWAATFSPPGERREHLFEALREHIVSRLARAPRYRQKLAAVPLDFHNPVWVDDDAFDPERHVLRTPATDLDQAVEAVMSVPLERDRPLWELWIADRLQDGRIGLIGKAHHCMVDGLAAVELGTLLLDPTPEAPVAGSDDWVPSPRPGRLELMARALADRAREQAALATRPLGLVRSPRRVLEAAAGAGRAARTLAGSALPLAPASPLNAPTSPLRRLVRRRRPLEDLREVKERFGTTVNDVLLAACAGGLRRFAAEHGEEPTALKAMVPVNVRGDDDGDGLGNRISFMFVELPCDREDPVERLECVARETGRRKRAGEPEDSDAALQAVAHAPRPLQRLVSHVVASPRMFNLVISNIPGPRIPLYMRGCRLEEAFPVVPLADGHAVSIGMTTVREDACLGIYADRKAVPDAERLADHIDACLDELVEAG
jgi:diacylglycerol O-acyltransferase / wax synthase